MWLPASEPQISYWEKWTAKLRGTKRNYGTAAATRSKIQRSHRPLPGQALGFDSHDVVCAGSVRVVGRRDSRGNRQAPGSEHDSGDGNSRLLLDASTQARR